MPSIVPHRNEVPVDRPGLFFLPPGISDFPEAPAKIDRFERPDLQSLTDGRQNPARTEGNPEAGRLPPPECRFYDPRMTTNRKRKEEIFDLLRPRLGEAITEIRGGMPREKLADDARMDSGTLRRLESGRAPFREDYISGICEALKIEEEDLLHAMVDHHRKKKTPPYRQMTDEEILKARRKSREAIARLQRESDEIETEILRRQLSRSEGPALPARGGAA